jgi:hypothetical protein
MILENEVMSSVLITNAFEIVVVWILRVDDVFEPVSVVVR